MDYSKSQLNALVILRLLIGWHFLYEGLLKVFTPGWTSQGYLLSSRGFLAPFFEWLASDALIGLVDVLTMIGLVGVGLSLLLGFFSGIGAIAGMVLLAFFYLSQPPFPWLEGGGPQEGNYLFVNKNLIELVVLAVLFLFPTSHLVGIDQLLGRKKTAARTA